MALGDLNLVVSAQVSGATQGLKQVDQSLQRVQGSMVRANQATRAMTNQFNSARTSTQKWATGALQQAGYQIGDFAVQVANGTSKMQAFGQQGSQLLGILGPIGAVLGAGVAIFSAFAVAAQRASGATKDAETQLSKLGDVDLGKIRGATSDLIQIQKAYNDVVLGSGDASTSAAKLVVANSEKEFAARKMVLSIERDLLRLRSQDQIEALKNLQRQQELFKADAEETLRTLGPGATVDLEKEAGGFIQISKRYEDFNLVIGENLKSLRANAAEIKLLEAELIRLGIASDEAEAALAMVFDVTPEANAATSAAGKVADAVKSISDTALSGIDKMFASLDDITNSVSKTMENAMTDAFMSIVDGTQKPIEAFKNMARLIIAELYKVLVVKQLVGSFDAANPGAATGIVGFLGKAFGGYMANGGPVSGGTPYIVGERGPELFVPSRNGTIVPNGAGAGVTVIQNNTFGNGVSRAEVQAMLPRIVETTKAAVFDAQRRSVNGLGYA